MKMKNGLHTEYYENGNKWYEEYWIDGWLHREDGPAMVVYHENGDRRCEGYYIDGEWHKEDAPAWIVYYKNGDVELEEYYKDGKLHREDGAARIWYSKNGKVEKQRWFKDGKLLKTIPKPMLEAYMKTNNMKLVDLLTSNDRMIRKNAEKYHWKEIV